MPDPNPRHARLLSYGAWRGCDGSTAPDPCSDAPPGASPEQLHSLARASEGADTIPGAQMAVIDGRGHELDVDEPEACIAALLKFLRSLE